MLFNVFFGCLYLDNIHFPPYPVGKHPVSALVELCNRRKWGAPAFELVHESGPDHKKNFLFKVRQQCYLSISLFSFVIFEVDQHGVPSYIQCYDLSSTIKLSGFYLGVVEKAI